MNNYRISRIDVELEAVVDCRDLCALGVTREELLSDTDYEAGQTLAHTAITKGAEGILAPSATRIGDNLILFPNQLRSTSRLEVTGFRDELHLYPAGDSPQE